MPLTKHFHYKNNELYCDRLRVRDIARKIGTPFYLYSASSFREQFLSLQKALKSLKPLICYAVKANSNIAILNLLAKLGAGFDIVSGGELFRALKAGADPKKIVYAGVGKTRSEIREAIRVGIFSFNDESLPELALINKEAKRVRKVVRVALRINPDVDAGTHKKITTGRAENKFGIDLKTAEKIFLSCGKFSNLLLSGVHVHIGSQILDSKPFLKAYKRVLDFVSRLEKKGIKIDTLDLGGGLGIVYRNEKPLNLARYGRQVSVLFKNKKLKILLEPGRFICGNSGALVTQVEFVKKAPKKNFIVVDAAMNDLARPAIYEAYHEIVPANAKKKSKRIKADVVGPICESGDVLGFARTLPEPEAGDLLAILSAGAYGFSMSSNYNSRPRPAEILVDGSRMKIIRKRETHQDLIKGESL